MLNGNQGTKAASNIWYHLLAPLLEKYGFRKFTANHAFFVKIYDDYKFFICLATDDLLCSFPTYSRFDDLISYLQQYNNLLVQTGHVLTFLSLQIIQSDFGISLDQAEYVYNYVTEYFGNDIEKLKMVNTPMRTDANFKKELMESLLLSASELQSASLDHKGGYQYHTGKLQWASSMTRLDIAFPMECIAEYNSQPTLMAFQCVSHILCYLAKDMLHPLMFP